MLSDTPRSGYLSLGLEFAKYRFFPLWWLNLLKSFSTGNALKLNKYHLAAQGAPGSALHVGRLTSFGGWALMYFSP